jgi:hypothetical protein
MRILIQAVSRFLLRFMLFYWICFIFPFPFDLIGLPLQLIDDKGQPAWMNSAGEAYGKAYSRLFELKGEACKWVGSNVLGVEVIIQPTGSGDTMRSYVGCFCAAGIALGLAVLWSMLVFIVRRWRPDWRADSNLNTCVRTLVRFFLFQMLLGYGFAKVFPLQFAQPSSSRLSQPLGDMSPMGLLWTFMGFSPVYQIFSGAVEVLGGVLLTTRRTALLGALVTVVAMTQIFALNMCFDVPVKLYSLHYLIMAIFLIVPDLPWLVSILVMGRAAGARAFLPPLDNARLGWFTLGLRTLVVAGLLYTSFQAAYQRWQDTHGGPPLPVTGRWEVVSMRQDGTEADKSDVNTWAAIDFTNKSMVRSFGSKPPNVVYRAKWNVAESNLSLSKFSAPTWSASFTYALPEPDKLELQGTMDGKAVAITLKPAPIKQYELMTRSFHWIQELPYNR